MNDPIRTVTQFRPTDSALDALWAPADRDAVLDDIVTTRRRRSRRRVLLGVAGVAAASAAVLTVALVPGGPATTQSSTPHQSVLPPAQLAAAITALHNLAGVAASRPSHLGTGQFWHMRIREQQQGPEGQSDSVTRMESWTDPDGRVWRHDLMTLSGQPSEENYYEFPPGSDQVNYPSPAYLDTLPTDRDALYDFLDAHVQGSSSHEEAIFVAVGDMLRGGFAPPELRSAAIQVLTRLPHVSLSDTTTDPLGRTVQQFDFIDQSIRPGADQSISFDPQTAQILDEGLTSQGGPDLVQRGQAGDVRTLSSDMTFTSSVVATDTVDEIPQDVLDNAVLQHG